MSAPLLASREALAKGLWDSLQLRVRKLVADDVPGLRWDNLPDHFRANYLDRADYLLASGVVRDSATLIAEAQASALRDAAADWAADPDAVGDSYADARNWLRDRAAVLAEGPR